MAKANSAAFFDLDRTLLAGSSAPVFQKHLSEYGLGTPSSSLTDAYYKIYKVLGENELVMQGARFGSRMAKGWSVELVRAACDAAAQELIATLQPFCGVVFENHRAAGTKLVLATTSPEPWVAPLAEALGFDGVVATRWVEEDGFFTGATEGEFLWARKKKDACVAWANANGVSMKASFAYSDSYFDTPLLDAVGHPIAVNPDIRLAGVAALKGWEIRHLDAPEGVVKVAGFELQEWLRPFMRPDTIPGASFDIDGLDNIAGEGGLIMVANHRSYFDPTVMVLLASMAGRQARFLGKKEVFDAPLVGTIAKAAGGIRVERGSGSDKPLKKAVEALKGGDLVVIMPQGTIPRGPAFFEPELVGRWGAARLAGQAGVPIVPVGLWGTEKVWPRSAKVPQLNPASSQPVSANVGEPIYLEGDDHEANTKLVMAAISKLLPPEASEPYEPTDAELRATYPAGYDGDPSKESNRRPGSDTKKRKKKTDD